MTLEHILDLEGIDVLAAAHEHVVGPAGEVVEAAAVAAHHVPGVVPAVAQLGAGHLGQVQVLGEHRRGAHLEHPFVARSANQSHFDIRQRIAERQERPRQPLGMVLEDRGAGFGRAVAVADRRLRKHLLHARHQRLGERRRADGHGLHRAQVERCEQLALAGHERKHGRDAAQERAAILGRSLQVRDRIKARHEHDFDGVEQAHGDIEERVHVIERRDDERALARRRGRADVHAERPQLPGVRQHHALRPAGRPRGVEDLTGRWRRAPRRRRGCRPARLERRRARGAHHDARQRGRNQRLAGRIHDAQLCPAVGEDVAHRVRRQAVIHRHAHAAGAHRAHVRDEVLGAVLGEDRDARVRGQRRPHQRGRESFGRCIQLRAAPAPARRGQVNDRQALPGNVGADQIAAIAARGKRHAAASHGFSSTLPTTSRSSSSRSPSAASASGSTRSITGLRRPSRIRPSSASRSATDQPFEPM